ncbi:MAG: AzlD domain-containing protein [Rothia sp. (in: high G+C Gram-positive bacteria)]|uniref:branched-chain amino acid transporter permease n=1 Tax=Rothia sp. (in: high G+C Gram-positive bacteria) TaxID=1885016 RepID=UPI0026E089C0|nr:AzlD domain-containing protein [Rothia sp. (in: high G+C Gram-positive bacteria)]MDO5750066.1 AzlD domain-containing protein [Rothia sp. (in: high G+C Gram-positive bacteria)]
MINGSLDTGYIIAAVLIAAAITFTLRLVPFGVKKALAGSTLMEALSQWLPLGAVGLLAIYALSHMHFDAPGAWVPQAAGAVATVAVHLWRKNIIYSMVAGTAVCVLLANLVF